MRLVAFVLLFLACTPAKSISVTVGADADPTELPRFTPRWAFEPWISKDISTGPDTYAFVDGFIARDIPVGVVVLDSPWETNYHSFVPNPDRYPEFPKMVNDLRGRGVRTVLWMTQMLNTASFDAEVGGDHYVGASPNFGLAKRNGYFVNDGALETWWKGQGAAIDFFNPEAVTWFRAQQDDVLATGIAGWKLDFGDSYITRVPIQTFAGPKSLQEYSEAYYRDFLVHGLKRRGRDEFLTMVRPYDKSYVFEGRFFARPEHAPVGWVGDNRRDWVGLEDALDEMFRSARAGYVVLGSDIGGYLDIDDVNMSIRVPFNQTNFIRWVALGAMTPFMQLHGRGNLTPWTVSERVDETVSVYRYWAKLHHQLVPFFFSTAQEAYAGAAVPMQPVGELADWPHDYRYVLGDSFLVAPILDDSGVRDVAFPTGSRWMDWWTNEVHEGGTTLSGWSSMDRKQLPLFVKEGSLIPLEVGDDSTALGTSASAGRPTVLAWPSTTLTHFVTHDEDGATTEYTAVRDAAGTTVSASRIPRGLVLRVFVESTSVQVEGLTETTSRAAFDASESSWLREGPFIWVRVAPGTASVKVTLRP